MAVSLNDDVTANIAKFNAAHTRAVDKWNSWAVTVNSYVGGEDPKQVIGAIEEIYSRGDRWKQRGAGLAAAHPITLADGKTDTYAMWIDLGNTLIHELQTTADDATNDSIVSNAEFVTKQTVDTIGGEIVDTAMTLNGVLRWLASNKKWLIPLALVGVAAYLLWQVGALARLFKRST